MSRRRTLLLTTAAALVPVLVLGGWWFEPWRLVTSSTLDEAAPAGVRQTSAPVVADLAPRAATPSQASPSQSPSQSPSATPVVRELSAGEFEDAEHDTSGRASLLRLEDGRRVLRLEGFSTSDGPDVHVWLSAAPSGGRWGSYDDGAHVRLGRLKATRGNQTYLVPDSASLAGMRSAVIWCDRFSVAFGSAPLPGLAG